MTDFRNTFVSPDGEHRAVVFRRPDGLFQVCFERYDESSMMGIGGMSDPFWRPEGQDAVVESLEQAASLASITLGLPDEAAERTDAS